MSSASSMARWIDCTVDSMFTTTPFLRPREGCVPMPITSIELSAATSPTSADTFEVPTSRPMIRFLSVFLAIRIVILGGAARDALAALAPPDRESVRVAHVDVVDVAGMRGDLADAGLDEAREALVHLPAAEPHRDAVVEIEFPRAARVEPHRGQPHAGLGDLRLRGELAARDRALGAERAGEPGQLGRDVARLGDEQFAARVEQAIRAPARRRHLLRDADVQRARPLALDRRAIYPGQLFDRPLHGVQIHADEPDVAHARLDRLLDLDGRHALEAAGDRHLRDVLIDRAETQ